MGDKQIISTLRYSPFPEWAERVDVVDRFDYGLLAFVREVVRRARGYETVILSGNWRSDQLAAIGIARLRRPPRVVMTVAAWKRGTSLVDRAANALGFRALRGRHIVFCVLSSDELESFPRTWGVAPEQVRFVPFGYTVPDGQLDLPVTDAGVVFAGGDSLRDYGPLIQAAREMDAPIRIASRRLGDVAMPANVVAGPVPPDRYDELFRTAAVVVVPLAGGTDRSAGQQTYLNAMAIGKPVIVTDAPGVRDYVDDRATGLIVPSGDAGALATAIRWVLDPANRDEVSAMRARARDVARTRFSTRSYVSRILAVADEGWGP
jgi:hypothetical protein